MSSAPNVDGWLPDLAAGPAAIKRWLVDVEPGHQPPARPIDWLGLAEATASLARESLDLDWAEIAIHIYDRLARKVESPSRRESLSYSQMNLRAFLITRVGAVDGHPVLDPRTVVDWFAESAQLPLESAVEDAARWPSLGVDRVRELRRIKNRLAPVKLLDEYGFLPREADASVRQWLAVRDRLP